MRMFRSVTPLRTAAVGLLAVVLAQPAFGQESGDVRSVSWWLDRWSTSLHVPRELLWTIIIVANLAVLFWVLYKLLFAGKDFNLPAMLRERERDITSRLEAAEEALRSARERLAAAEASVANLPAEVERLAAEARSEAEREYERVLADARQDAEAVAERARVEIESASKLAQKKLKTYAAELALDLAERRIREHMTPEVDRAVVREAVRNLNGNGRPV